MTTLLSKLDRFEQAAVTYETSTAKADRDELHAARRAIMEREAEAERYAERLATVLWEKHWKADSPQWRPLSGDLIGILTQIDNMTAGLVRASKGA